MLNDRLSTYLVDFGEKWRLTLGMSIETFCLKNKVPYNIFSKWYKDTRKKVVEVQVDGIPPVTETSSPKPSSPTAMIHAWTMCKKKYIPETSSVEIRNVADKFNEK